MGSQLVLPNNTSIVGHRDASLLCSVSHASALKLAGLNASIESLDVRCSTDAAVDQSVVWASGPSTSVRDVRFFDAPSGILVTSNSCSVSDVSMSNVRTLGGVLFNSQDPDARLDLAKVVVQCAANSNADGVVWYGAGTGNQQVALDTCTILNARRGFVTL